MPDSPPASWVQADENRSTAPGRKEVVLFTSFPPPYGGPSIWGMRMVEAFAASGVRTVAVSFVGRAPETPGVEHVRVEAGRPFLTSGNVPHIARALPLMLRDLSRIGVPRGVRDLRYAQVAEVVAAALRFPEVLAALRALGVRQPTVIVNGAHWWPALMAVLLCRRLPGSKLIIRAKGLDIDGIGAASPRATKLLLTQADTVVVASEHLRRAIVDRLGLPSESVQQVPNPVELPDLPAPPAKQSKVLFVGVLEPEKDPCSFIRAAAKVAADVSSATFTLIGEGSLRSELEALALALGIADRVRFAGRLDNPRVQEEMAGAAALVLPSRREAFGIVLVEAFANYTPCIVTDTGGMPEIVTPEEGFVVPPGDTSGMARALLVLLQDEPLRDRMGRNGRQRAERLYSLPAVTRQWMELLR